MVLLVEVFGLGATRGAALTPWLGLTFKLGWFVVCAVAGVAEIRKAPAKARARFLKRILWLISLSYLTAGHLSTRFGKVDGRCHLEIHSLTTNRMGKA